ncbi:MAG: T9SS type A sorting domain-containing protein [Bacteroidales bacterium]|jgi:hypothetical protein|nr:T9SS type A sorting domain-containing protein [Bacteroidales bacterium]
MKHATNFLKLLLAATALYSTVPAMAQGYQSYFGDSITVYHIFFPFTCYDPDPGQLGCGRTEEFCFTPKDTACINDTVYYADILTIGRLPYLREDTLTGRLYYRYPNSPERLICDMSLAPGDTFTLPVGDHYYIGHYWEEGAIMTVDSISYLNGRKVIHFSPLQTPYGYSRFYPYIDNWVVQESRYNLKIIFVEGIGPTYGVLGFISYTMENYLGVMLCVCKDDTLAYMTSPQLGCYQRAVSIKEPEANKMILYPNPATEELHIELLSEADAGGSLWIMDAVGQVVYRKAAMSACEVIPVAHLSSGLYVVQYQIKNRKFQSKFIKTK